MAARGMAGLGNLDGVSSNFAVCVADELCRLGIPAELVVRRALPMCEESALLNRAEVGSDGREHLLYLDAVLPWLQMKEAAAKDGIDIYIISAFRSLKRQAEIIERKLNSGLSLDDVLMVSAPPGYSEHHTGRAVDIGTAGVRDLEVDFENTKAFDWLIERAGEFGFCLSYPRENIHGFAYEPWHWCWHDAEELRKKR